MMKIASIGTGRVTVDLTPGECLLIADALILASEEPLRGTPTDRLAAALHDQAAATFEALALLGAAAGHIAGEDELLVGWNLPTVREHWHPLVGSTEVAG